MGNRSQRGQILIELLSLVALFITFMAISIALFEDYEKSSYQYLLTIPQKEKADGIH